MQKKFNESMSLSKKAIIISLPLLLIGCATPPPKNPENICEIFFEHREWYEAAKDMNYRWGTPIHVPIAMMYQESSFKHDAEPPMQYRWIIPIGRASDAYGYAQAKTMTWSDYQRETGNYWSDRDDFSDAVTFKMPLHRDHTEPLTAAHLLVLAEYRLIQIPLTLYNLLSWHVPLQTHGWSPLVDCPSTC